ncbi:MAG: hypothetical protein PWP27_1292 [Clostridiales bacterium]|jgi:hypothetical protein|nr:hypothetical protein [Clostridiales bacterium]MDK2933482.1 hypothetical protein [Clostridiales bacterium]
MTIYHYNYYKYCKISRKILNNMTIAFGELMCLSAQKIKVDCLDITLRFIIKSLPLSLST